MKNAFGYRLESRHHQLLHLLRFMVGVNGYGVFDRTWELPLIGLRFSPLLVQANLFPEWPENGPFLLDGERLIELAALSLGVEDETIVLRLRKDPSDGYDLVVYLNQSQPQLILETDEEELYLRVKDYFERTGGPEHRLCFAQ